MNQLPGPGAAVPEAGLATRREPTAGCAGRRGAGASPVRPLRTAPPEQPPAAQVGHGDRSPPAPAGGAQQVLRTLLWEQALQGHFLGAVFKAGVTGKGRFDRAKALQIPPSPSALSSPSLEDGIETF